MPALEQTEVRLFCLGGDKWGKACPLRGTMRHFRAIGEILAQRDALFPK